VGDKTRRAEGAELPFGGVKAAGFGRALGPATASTSSSTKELIRVG
jgi:acyl-CoA reductase-like NAD-dependent aldehyde dehydrogenase